MKKIIALLLSLCMVLSAAGFALADEAGLKDARSYINLMYKNKPASTPKDYEVIGSVPTDGDPIVIEWTADSDTITVTRLENGLVKIDVDEDNPKAVEYQLTATVRDDAGNEQSISFSRFVPAAINLDIMSEEEIVAVAYTLEDQAKLPAPTALCGEIVEIPTPYSEQYGNITVNIKVGDLADQLIQCYRLTGEGAADLEVGDHIAVFGVIKNYKGTIEFDAGCKMIPDTSCDSARVAGYVYALEEGAGMNRPSTITGVISEIPSAYSPDYGNITVNIDVPGLEGYTIQCYRLAGGEDLIVGDVITVYGTIKNYKGTIEFDKGCSYVKGDLVAELKEAFEQLEALDAEGDEDAKLRGLFGGEGSEGLLGLLGKVISLVGGEELQNLSLDSLLGGIFGGEGGEGLDLSGLLGGILGGEGGEGLDLSGLLNGIFGGEGGEGLDVSGLLNGLLGGEGGEGLDVGGLLGGIFGGEEGGEGTDLGGLLNGIFGSEEGGKSIDLGGLLNGIFGGEEGGEDADLSVQVGE